MEMSKKVSWCRFCLIFMNWYILVKNEMPACPYLSISWYKNTNHTFHISIELLLMFLIWKSLSFIFSQQYSQVLLNEDENLKCLKSETKEKMKNNYLYRCYCIHSKDSFLFSVCWIQQDDKRTQLTGLNPVSYIL